MLVIAIISAIIAALALLLSVYATLKTSRFNERQKSLIESQEKLNSLLIEKEESEVINEKQADPKVSIIKYGSKQHRFKLWNNGKSTAHNITIDFPEGNDVILQSEIDDKFPLESLEPLQSIELIASVTFQTKTRKLPVKIIWSDDYMQNNEKLVYATF